MNPNITPRERALLKVIRLADPSQGCRRSNPQLTRQLGIGARQVRTCLAGLRERKFLTVQIVSGNQRIIRLTAKGANVLKR